jgi:hypothetical protein
MRKTLRRSFAYPSTHRNRCACLFFNQTALRNGDLGPHFDAYCFCGGVGVSCPVAPELEPGAPPPLVPPLPCGEEGEVVPLSEGDVVEGDVPPGVSSMRLRSHPANVSPNMPASKADAVSVLHPAPFVSSGCLLLSIVTVLSYMLPIQQAMKNAVAVQRPPSANFTAPPTSRQCRRRYIYLWRTI